MFVGVLISLRLRMYMYMYGYGALCFVNKLSEYARWNFMIAFSLLFMTKRVFRQTHMEAFLFVIHVIFLKDCIVHMRDCLCDHNLLSLLGRLVDCNRSGCDREGDIDWVDKDALPHRLVPLSYVLYI